MAVDPVELLRALVRMDTSNPPGNEGPLLAFLSEMLKAQGSPYAIQLSAQNRGNLLAHLPATVTPAAPPIVLMSHVDVVAADAAAWRYPPFAAEMADGYIYGRGTVDTKQLTVMELIAFFAAKDLPVRTRDVYFLATCDEESGSAYGLQYLLSHPIALNGRMVDGHALFTGSDVISEGGGFPVVVKDTVFYLCETGQKGCGSVRFKVTDRVSQNPFMPTGDAVTRAMSLVQDISKTPLPGTALEVSRDFEQALKDAAGGAAGWEGLLSPGMRGVLAAMRRSTLTPTLIHGRNTAQVEVVCDVRLLPGFTREDLIPLLDGFKSKWDCDYQIESLSTGYQSAGGALIKVLEKALLARLDEPSARLLPFVSMGSSDGRFLTPYHANVYGFSPVLKWDMTFDSAVRMVHGTDERIHAQSVHFGCEVLTAALLDAVRA